MINVAVRLDYSVFWAVTLSVPPEFKAPMGSHCEEFRSWKSAKNTIGKQDCCFKQPLIAADFW